MHAYEQKYGGLTPIVVLVLKRKSIVKNTLFVLFIGMAELVSLTQASAARVDYENPKIIENILSGRLDEVPYNEVWVKNYLVEVAKPISMACPQYFTQSEVKLLKAQAVLKSMDWSDGGAAVNLINGIGSTLEYYKDPVRGEIKKALNRQEAEKIQLEQAREGLVDGKALLSKYKCGSAELNDFSINLKSFINNEGAKKASADELLYTCKSPYVYGSQSATPQYCRCVVVGLSNVVMTRAERKSLLSPYFHETVNYLKSLSANRMALGDCR